MGGSSVDCALVLRFLLTYLLLTTGEGMLAGIQ